jgi:mono/diheme cytochrome c family protein
VKWLLVLATLAVVTGCGTGGAGAGTGAGTDGRAVFQLLCATCHGEDGRPPAAMIARLGVRDLSGAEFRARVTPALVEHQVRAGSKSKLMPAFEGAISDAQIAAVSAYVASPQFVAPR